MSNSIVINLNIILSQTLRKTRSGLLAVAHYLSPMGGGGGLGGWLRHGKIYDSPSLKVNWWSIFYSTPLHSVNDD